MLNDADFNELLIYYPTLSAAPATLQFVLRQVGHCLQTTKNQIFFDMDTPCHTFAMLLSGSIRVIRPAKSGRELLLYRIRSGESCALTVSCLLGGKAYQAKGVVENKVTAVTIPQSLFIQLIEQAPSFRTFIFQFFSQRMAHLMALIEEIAFQRLDQRLATLLLSQGPTIEATHQQLADELGSVREVIGRLLRDFQDKGAIVLDRRHLQILDKAILQQIAHSERDASPRHRKGGML